MSETPVDHKQAAEQFENKLNADAEMSLEELKNKSTLQIEVRGDFNPLLEALNRGREKSLSPRVEGFHITVLGPADTAIVKALDESHLTQLRSIISAIGRGEGVTVHGIGYIDSTTEPNLVEKDKDKAVAFLALDIPALQEFRAQNNLQAKDFHITIGFSGTDIHFRQKLDDSGNPMTEIPRGADGLPKKGAAEKPVTEFIPKKADPVLTEQYGNLIPALQFQRLGGKEKQKAPDDINADVLTALQNLIDADSDLKKWGVNVGTIDTHVGKLRGLEKKIEKTADQMLKELKEKVSPKLFEGPVISELIAWLNANGLGKNIGEVRGKLAGLVFGTSRETVESTIQNFSIAQDKKDELLKWVDAKNIF